VTPRDALWLAAGALAYPLGVLVAHLIFHHHITHPH